MSEDIKPYNEDYINAYKAGFGDGWDAAKQSIERALRQANENIPYKFNQGCSICGIGANGEPLGYACQHPACPSKITFTHMMSGGIANCAATVTNTNNLSGL